MKSYDLTGKRFNRWTVISKYSAKRLSWLCKCDCGNYSTVPTDNLISGKSKSCGCIRKERIPLNKKHGEANKSVEWKTWQWIKSRCKNKNNKIYGARNINVCERWKSSYYNFLTDMGRKPFDNYSIDRIDVNGDYEPNNCRWASKITQANNTRKNNHVNVGGVEMTIAQLSDLFKIKYDQTYYNIITKKENVNIFLSLLNKKNNDKFNYRPIH